MGFSLPAGTNIEPVRVHGKKMRVTSTLDECDNAIHLLLSFTCSDDKHRNVFLVLNSGNTGDAWDALLEFATDDKKPDEVVVWMSEHGLAELLEKAWSPRLRVVPYEE